MIPLVDLPWQHTQIEAEILPRLHTAMQRGDFILGHEVASFEAEFAAYVNGSHCVAVSSGTDALELALRAARIPKGSHVVIPAFTFVATAAAVVRAGLKPVLVDVSAPHLLLDPERVAAALTPKVRAIVAVHLFGQMAPMAELRTLARSQSILLVEDAAQSQGSTHRGHHMGYYSSVAATSFYPGKNLGAYGDAGAIITNCEPIASRAALLRDHGSESKYSHTVVGTNARMDVLQAIVLRAKLTRLSHWDDLRRTAAQRYTTMLAGQERVELPSLADRNAHCWHLYVVRVKSREHIYEAMRRDSIQVGIHYPTPVHLSPAFRYLGLGLGAFPIAEAAARQVLTLPLYPGITVSAQECVVDSLLRALT